MKMMKTISKIYVSKHAVSRFKERFRLYFKSHVFSTFQNIVWFIQKLVNEGYEDVEFSLTPFYVNKLASKHNGGCVKINNSFMTFICKRVNYNEFLVLTVLLSTSKQCDILASLIDKRS